MVPNTNLIISFSLNELASGLIKCQYPKERVLKIILILQQNIQWKEHEITIRQPIKP